MQLINLESRFAKTWIRIYLKASCLLLLLSTANYPFAASIQCGTQKPTSPVWVSRCYDGLVTLDNFETKDSQERRLASTVTWSVLQSLLDLQIPAASGQAVSAEQVMGITLFLVSGGHLGWAHDVTEDKSNVRMTGPVIQSIGFDTHQRVSQFYSDGVVNWLKNDRVGSIPDGSVIVKQMYVSNPTDSVYGADRVTGWAVMVKYSQTSHDGWLWYLFFFPKTPPLQRSTVCGLCSIRRQFLPKLPFGHGQ